MKTFKITVKKLVNVDKLIKEDKTDWRKIVGDHEFEATDKEDALDAFHSNVPIACLDHFEISCEEIEPEFVAEAQTEEKEEEKVEITKPEAVAQTKPAELPKAAQAKKDVMATTSGMLKGTSLEEQWRLATAYCQSGMLPKSYKTPQQVLTGMQYAYELGLKPLMALKNIAVINGQPSLWGDLPLGIVRNSKMLTFIDEYLIDKDYKKISLENKNLHKEPYAAVCILEREGNERKEFYYTREMRQKQNGGVAAIWNSYEEIMFKRKARGTGLKDLFPDVLEGMNIAEYDFNIIPEAGGEYNVNHDGTPNQTAKTNDFASKFKKEDTIEVSATKLDETCDKQADAQEAQQNQ